ncbi:MAG: adenylate kinase [Oscillospiraceae bacterium]
MVILISGCSHTGKTLLAQQLLEKYKYPYLSIDHLKMGLIRSGQTALTPEDDKELVPYLWSIVKEIVKTAVENEQNLIIEGCYIPFDWKKDFDESYLRHIKYRCLIMTEKYIKEHFADIKSHANAIEKRLDDSWLNAEQLIAENAENLEMCRKYGCEYIFIDEEYEIDLKGVSL